MSTKLQDWFYFRLLKYKVDDEDPQSLDFVLIVFRDIDHRKRLMVQVSMNFVFLKSMSNVCLHAC